jgi:hypothetical protein
MQDRQRNSTPEINVRKTALGWKRRFLNHLFQP